MSRRPRTVFAGMTIAALGAACLLSIGPVGPPPAGAASGRCSARSVAPVPPGPSEQAVVVQEGGSGDPRIEMVRYPRPDSAGRPWSQWGQGVVLPDGKFVSAMGNHLGPDGDSYVFVYDPESSRLVRVADVLSETDHNGGEFGYGKVHAQMVAGPCGETYLATYWGTRDDLAYTGNYRGDHLMRLDPRSWELESLGVPVEEHGIPSLAASPDSRLIYGEATDPFLLTELERDGGAFFVYDPARQKVVFRSDEREHTLFRSLMVGGDGRVYMAKVGGGLLAYEPRSNRVVDAGIELPGGGGLRAATVPGPDGTVYGVTQGDDEAPDVLFALERSGSIRRLGDAEGYTTSLALSEDGSHFYYVPGAHGDSSEWKTPVIAVDTETGEQTVVAELADLAPEGLDLTLAGSYNVVLDREHNRLFVGFNAGGDPEDPWGEVVLAIVHLP